MKITVIAATGGIGRHLVDQAAAAGHQVTAVVRNPSKLTQLNHDVRVVTCDLAAPDRAVLQSAIAGADAVVSGLGPHSQREAGIAEPGTRAVVEAMQATGARRIVVVSAAPVSTTVSPGRPYPPKHDPAEGLIMRRFGAPLAKRFLGKVFIDLALMEDILRESGLDWTAVRPPRLTDKPLTGTYRTAVAQNLKRGSFVSRANVAHYMLGTLDNPETIKQAIGIAD